jgi:hypothetical protein
MACRRVKVGRRLVFMRLPPGRVNGHHPYGPFTRVVTAYLWPRLFGLRPDWSGCRSAGQSRPSSRARVTAAARFSTQSLRYSARWWVFTVFRET